MRRRIPSTSGKVAHLTVALIALLDASAASPIAYRRIDTIVKDAERIVVGTVATLESRSLGDRMTIQVLEQLKGSSSSQLQVALRSGIAAPGFEGRRVLAFLVPDTTGQELRLHPIVDGAQGLVEFLFTTDEPVGAPLVPVRSGDTPLVRVIKELGTIQVHSRDNRAYQYLSNLAWQGEVEVKTLSEVFQAMSASPVRRHAQNGVAGLLMLGGLEGVVHLDRLIPQLSDDKDVQSLASLLERFYKARDSRGVAVLRTLVQSAGSRSVRVASAGALARVHTAEMVPILADLLNDPDFDIRARVIGGLSMFANNVAPGSGHPGDEKWPFRTEETIRHSAFDSQVLSRNEAEYLNFWRDWWNSNQAAVARMAAAPSVLSPSIRTDFGCSRIGPRPPLHSARKDSAGSIRDALRPERRWPRRRWQAEVAGPSPPPSILAARPGPPRRLSVRGEGSVR